MAAASSASAGLPMISPSSFERGVGRQYRRRGQLAPLQASDTGFGLGEGDPTT